MLVGSTATRYVGFGEGHGQEIACRWEARALFEVERRSVVLAEATTEASLPEKVAAAVASLRARGFEPNILILPQQERFARPFVGRPTWKLRNGDAFGSAHIGHWQGLELFRCPYPNTAAAVVGDARRLFGWDDSRLKLSAAVEKDDAEAHRAILRRAEAAASDDDLPAVRDVAATLRWAFDGPLVIRDPQASAKVSLDLRSLGYVLPDGSDEYHRPGCERTGDLGSTLSSNGNAAHSARRPCAACRPDEWDYPE